MCELDIGFETDRCDDHGLLHFTPAEWRSILDDPAFLDDVDNDWHAPRRLLGVAVRIVPSHAFG